MNRLPLGASFEDAFHALQPQQPQQSTRAQHPPSQIRPIAASYEPSLPSGSEMPDEWGYPPPGLPQFSNIPRNVQGTVAHPTGSVPRGTPQSHPTATVTAPTVPTCRYPNCRRRVDRDERTQELTEYCSLDHMRDAVQHFGFPLCPACKRCPRRSDSKFCGSLCEQWAMQRQQQLQQQRQLQSQGLHQQHHQQQHQHQRQQHWPPSTTMGPPSTVPNSSAVTWSNAARRSSYSGNSGPRDSSGWQGRYQQ